MALPAIQIAKLAARLIIVFRKQGELVGPGGGLDFLDVLLGNTTEYKKKLQDVIAKLDKARLLDDLIEIDDITELGSSFIGVLKTFQKSIGGKLIDELGFIGPSTLLEFDRCLLCSDLDPAPDTAPARSAAELDPTTAEKTDFSYFVRDLPVVSGFETLAEILLTVAMDQWQSACAVRFVPVPENDAQLVITQERLDGKGGDLARANVGPPTGLQLTLRFDANENYVANSTEQGTVFVAVALHELGHCMGISHSGRTPDTTFASTDVMFGNYGPGKIELTDTDKRRAVKIWGPP